MLAIRDQFWINGYAATSLDDLVSATSMNRPSLYAAFGDKADMYLAALRMHGELMVDAARAVLQLDLPLQEAMRTLYDRCIGSYLQKRRGCFLCSALSEAAAGAEVKTTVQHILLRCESLLESRFVRAQTCGELSLSPDPKVFAALTSSTLREIAIWVRAGATREFIEERKDWALQLVLASAPLPSGYVPRAWPYETCWSNSVSSPITTPKDCSG